MFDWVCSEFIMWQTYRDRLREAEKNRLAKQARTGQMRSFHPPSWVRPLSEGHASVLAMVGQGRFRREVEEAARVSSSGGGLML
jgi:hypothetical protein